jgi:D-arabinose 1-dehydrogenase-like Zn-dependent alcohol dehydrogenase
MEQTLTEDRYQTVMAKYGKIFPLTISFAAEPIPMLPMVTGGLSIIGSAVAHRQSIKEMLKFVAKHDIKPQIQKFPMSKDGVTEALAVLNSGKMRYRGVVVV